MKKNYIEKKEIIEKLQKVDYEIYAESERKFPLISTIPDENRIDCFDIEYGSGENQKLDIHRLKGEKKRPVIMFIHGGGWAKRDKDQSRFFVPAWTELGYVVVSINYRLTNPSANKNTEKNVFPAQIDDCAAALKWVTENIEKYGGDSNKIAVAGQSSGAHLAALLVSDKKSQGEYNIDMSKVKCWLGLSGIYDLNLRENYYNETMTGFIKAFIDEESKLYDASPINFIDGKEPPCLLIHGSNDYMIPAANTFLLYEKLLSRGAKAEILILDNAHMDYFSKLSEKGQAAEKPIKEFFKKYFI